VGRLGEDLAGVALLGDPPRVHDRNPVACLGDDSEVVGDQQQTGIEVGAQVGEDPEDLCLDDHVEGRRRLVGYHQARLEDQRQRDHDPLAHPARELVRILLEARGRDAHLRQCFERALAHLIAIHSGAVSSQRFEEVALDRVQGVEPGHRLLEDQSDSGPAQVAKLVGVEADEIATLVENLSGDAGVCRQQAEDPAPERRLSAAGLADEADGLAAVDLERDSVDRAHGIAAGPVPDAKPADVENRAPLTHDPPRSDVPR
jgi:hypothetical protein